MKFPTPKARKMLQDAGEDDDEGDGEGDGDGVL